MDRFSLTVVLKKLRLFYANTEDPLEQGCPSFLLPWVTLKEEKLFLSRTTYFLAL